MSKYSPGIAVIIPCFNEEERLPTDTIASFLKSEPGYHFVMVDDGSQDNTLEVFEQLRSDVGAEQVEIVALSENRGKAEATRLGMLHAIESGLCQKHGVAWVGYLDADLATPLSEMRELVRIGCENPHVQAVLGSRLQLSGRQIERTLMRRTVSRIFSVLTSMLFRLQIRDTQCGAKLFRKQAWLHHVCQRPFSDRWLFDVELLVRIRQVFGKRFSTVVYEYPLCRWRDESGSRLRLTDFAMAPVSLLKMATKYWVTSPAMLTEEFTSVTTVLQQDTVTLKAKLNSESEEKREERRAA